MRANRYNEFFNLSSKIRDLIEDSEEFYSEADVQDLKDELEQLLFAVENVTITEEWED